MTEQRGSSTQADSQRAPDAMSIDLIFGMKTLIPVEYDRRVEREGFMQWRWVIECEFSKVSGGPFWTRGAAERDMARYPT